MSASSLLIDIQRQSLIVRSPNGDRVFPVSTAFAGTGQKNGSGCTPLGMHVIRAKIGTGLPVNAVLVGRRWTGEIFSQDLADAQPDRDWILSRILWLSGTEIGFNRLGDVDSMRRYIYIHGTPDSEPMKQPRSHGCIRMTNLDVIALFEMVEPGCNVHIVESF